MKIVIDLGCGDKLVSIPDGIVYGVDNKYQAKQNENIINLDLIENAEGLYDVFKSNSVDIVYANDFLEHLPTIWKVKDNNIFPRVILFNVIWKLLKQNGEFRIHVPYFNGHNIEWAMDPTHIGMPWTIRSFEYFSNHDAYPRLQEIYGIECRFKVVSIKESDTHLDVILQK